MKHVVLISPTSHRRFVREAYNVLFPVVRDKYPKTIQIKLTQRIQRRDE